MLKKIFIIMIILYPITEISVSPVPGVGLGTLGFILIMPIMVYSLTKKNGKVYLPLALITLLSYTMVTTLIHLIIPNMVYYTDHFSILSRLFRFEFILITVIILGLKSFFDFQYAIKILRFVTLVAAGYAILQLVAYKVFGLILPFRINGFSLEYPPLVSQFRGYSFFAEPSNFSYFVMIYLSYCLFSIKSRKSIYESLFITAGVIATTSGQGLIAVIFIWTLWFLKNIYQKKEGLEIKIKFLFVTAPVMIFMFLFLSDYDLIEFTISRLFNFEEMTTNRGVDGRMEGYEWFLQLPLNLKFTGIGFGNFPEGEYLSSGARMLVSGGYIGAFILFILFLNVFIKGVGFQRVLVVIFLLLMVGGGVYTTTWLALYLPFLQYKINKNN